MKVSIVMKLIDGVTGPIKKVSQAIDAATEKIDKAKERADKAFKSAANIKHAADGVLAFAGSMRTGLVDVIKQASDFEQAMLGVAKQIEGARDPSGKLTTVYFDMAKQIQALGRETPMATSAIAEMVAAGARMSIPKDELIEFTKTAAMMAEAFELPAGQLAEQMGQIKLLFGIKTQDDVRALADTINYLDDNAISKGGDIVDVLKRVGGVKAMANVTATGMAALSSTLLTLGERSENAGTSVNAIFSKLAAANKGSKDLRNAMHELGLSTDEIQKGMQVDGQETFLKVLDAINKMPKDQRVGVMVDLVGLNHSDTLAKLAGGVEEYRKQIGLANGVQAKGSMNREYQARLATTAAQWEIMKNRATELAVNIGTKVLPEINKLLGVIGPLVSKVSDWIEQNPKLTKTLFILAAAISGIATAVGGLMLALGAIVATKGLLILAGGFTAVFAPAVLAGIAIASVTLAITELVKAWESLDALEVLKGMADVAGEAGMKGDNPAFAIAKQFLDPRALMDSIGLTGEAAGRMGTPFSMLGDAVTSGAGVGPLKAMTQAGAPVGELVIKFDDKGQPQVKSLNSAGIDLKVESTTGRMMNQ